MTILEGYEKEIEFRMVCFDDDGNEYDILNLIDEVKLMRLVNDGQAALNTKLREEVKRLKAVDAALKDFNSAILREELLQYQREGFDEVVASRTRKPFVSKDDT